jgi:hypothetical protein
MIGRARAGADLKCLGTCQVRTGGRKRNDSDYEWTAEHGHVAGYLVSGIPGFETYEKGGGYDSG